MRMYSSCQRSIPLDIANEQEDKFLGAVISGRLCPFGPQEVPLVIFWEKVMPIRQIPPLPFSRTVLNETNLFLILIESVLQAAAWRSVVRYVKGGKASAGRLWPSCYAKPHVHRQVTVIHTSREGCMSCCANELKGKKRVATC